MDRRERYFLEENGVNKELSLEQMFQDRVQLSYVGAEMTPSAEELLLESDEARTWKKGRKGCLLLWNPWMMLTES